MRPIGRLIGFSERYPRCSLYLLSGLLLAYILVPGLRVLFKYLPYPQISFLIFASIVVILILSVVEFRMPKILALTSNPWFIAILLAGISIACWFIYPIADGLKLQMKGSDQDDCVIIGATRLASMLYPYTEKSYFGNPCSPGPGLLMLYLPFVLTKTYILGAVASIVALCFCIQRQYNNWGAAGLFLILICSCAAMVELLMVGSDLILLGCGFAILPMLTIRAVESRNVVHIVLLGLLCGLLSSSRVNFMVLFPAMSIFILPHWRRGAIIFFIASMIAAIVPSLALYLINPADFTPLHLIGKAGHLLSKEVMYFGVLTTLLAGVFSILLVKKKLDFIVWAVFILFCPMLIILSVGYLYGCSGNFAEWKGANYLIPLVPLAAVLFLSINHPESTA